MATDDLYKKLQVDPQAESEVIRAAYHALSRKYHPDAGGDLQRMVELNAAWAILGHPLTRSAYDAERAAPQASPAPIERAEPHVKPGRGRSDGALRTRRDSSSTLDFGRYAGWSLEQLVEKDPDYLEWMVRTPIGRRLAAEVKALLEVRAAGRPAVGVEHRGRRAAGRQWFGRMTRSS